MSEEVEAICGDRFEALAGTKVCERPAGHRGIHLAHIGEPFREYQWPPKEGQHR